MNHADHVMLIQKAVDQKGGIWADFGSGRGAFTLALAELLGSKGTIYSVDKDVASLREQEEQLSKLFPEQDVIFLRQDFTHPLTLPQLDGIIMANSLHFLKEKSEMLQTAKFLLREGGRLVLVEYNTDVGNAYVPYPLSFTTFTKLAEQAGFSEPVLSGSVPSTFLREIYAAYVVNTSRRLAAA